MKRPREEAGVPDANGLTVLHRVRASSRLVPWKVAAVTSIAACPDGSVFAAGYDDGKVEIYDAELFNVLARIPGADGSEISSVAWARAPGDPHWRLFAATLEGTLLELSCRELRPVASTDSFGGAIWCLRAAPSSNLSTNVGGGGGYVTQLAAACGDGSIKLYQVHARVPGAEYVRSLPRVEGNVLALTWHPQGHSIVSGGSDGCIHCWDVKQGNELQRITVGTSSTAPPCVWSLAVLPDSTIVSGDGDGAVQFWDGRFGTLLSRQQQFVADVLALAASPDGSHVWASGVDPRVALFHRVPDKATGVPAWVYLDRKQPHTHDVRSLAVLTRPDSHPMLISGGNDGQLVLYSLDRFLKEHPTRQSKSPQVPLLQLSCGRHPARLLHVHQHTLSIWQLGRAVQQQPLYGTEAGRYLEGDHWDLAALPSQLASITTSSSNHIIAAALAPDCSAVAAADTGRLRLFRLSAAAAGSDAAPGGAAAAAADQEQGAALEVQKLKVSARLDAPVVCCVFSSNSKVLFAATGSGCVAAVDAVSGELVSSQQLAGGDSSKGKAATAAAAAGPARHQHQHQESKASAWCTSTAAHMPAVSSMAASANGQLLAVATPSGVELLTTTQQLQHRCRLMLLGAPAPITAIAFSANSKFIAVGTAANALTVYSSDTGMPTQWTLKNHAAVAELLEQLPGSIQGLSFRPTPSEPLSLLVHSAGGLCCFDMSQALSVHRPSDKVPRSKKHPSFPQPEPFSEQGRNGRLLKLQHCCLLIGHLSATEALLLEKPWSELLQQLLPPMYRHRYGS